MKKLPDRNRNRSAANPRLPMFQGMNNGNGKLPEGQQRLMASWQRLVAQAHRINQLSHELEMAMFEFKAIANTVNSQWHHLQTSKRNQPDRSHQNLCQYGTIAVPYVGETPTGSLLLTTKPIDLFRAEREATQLAQTLRNHSKRKRIPPPTARKHRRISNPVWN